MIHQIKKLTNGLKIKVFIFILPSIRILVLKKVRNCIIDLTVLTVLLKDELFKKVEIAQKSFGTKWATLPSFLKYVFNKVTMILGYNTLFGK